VKVQAYREDAELSQRSQASMQRRLKWEVIFARALSSADGWPSGIPADFLGFRTPLPQALINTGGQKPGNAGDSP